VAVNALAHSSLVERAPKRIDTDHADLEGLGRTWASWRWPSDVSGKARKESSLYGHV
jgi:hypothetical protein